jgi:hypothetical protein
MTNRLHHNKLHRLDYTARRKRGQCAHCANPARPGKTTCPACGQKDVRYQVAHKRERRRLLIKLGVCPRCEVRQAIKPGVIVKCGPCQETHAETEGARKARYRTEGRCPLCGGQPAEGFIRCEACLGKRRKTTRRNAGQTPARQPDQEGSAA